MKVTDQESHVRSVILSWSEVWWLREGEVGRLMSGRANEQAISIVDGIKKLDAKTQ